MSDDLKKEETPKQVEVDAVQKELKEVGNSTPIKSTRELSTTSTNLPSDYSQVAQAAENLNSMLALADVYVKASMCPLKRKEDVVIAITTGQQFGFPFMTSINNIYPINGKPTMSAHLHRAVLLQHKVVFKKVDDYAPVYNYYEADEKGNAIKDRIGDKDVPRLIGNFTINSAPKNSVKGRKEVDRITTYSFTREVRLQSGKLTTISTTSSFSMSEANIAGLLEKDNWIKYPARMLDARAFTIGAKEIADDLLLGIPSISEIAEVYDVPYKISENYEETVVTD